MEITGKSSPFLRISLMTDRFEMAGMEMRVPSIWTKQPGSRLSARAAHHGEACIGSDIKGIATAKPAFRNRHHHVLVQKLVLNLKVIGASLVKRKR